MKNIIIIGLACVVLIQLAYIHESDRLYEELFADFNTCQAKLETTSNTLLDTQSSLRMLNDDAARELQKSAKCQARIKILTSSLQAVSPQPENKKEKHHGRTTINKD